MEYNLVKLNLARNCLRYVVKLYNIQEIFLPYYICPTVRQALQKENCKLKFYHIDENFYPILNFDKKAFIIYPNYFGICAKNVEKLLETYPNLIVDNAHNFYMQPVGIASVYSLRKFFDVTDGAYLYTLKAPNLRFEKDTFIPTKKIFSHEDFVKNELRLNNEDIKIISDFTDKKFKTFDLENLKKKRLEKFEYFHSKYKKQNLLKFDLTVNDVPFCYPLMTEKAFPSELRELEIYRYWSPLPKEFLEYKFYKNLIPIPLK